MDKITKINHEHFHDVTIAILAKYNMNNECNSSSLDALTKNYIEKYINTYNLLVEKNAKHSEESK